MQIAVWIFQHLGWKRPLRSTGLTFTLQPLTKINISITGGRLCYLKEGQGFQSQELYL